MPPQKNLPLGAISSLEEGAWLQSEQMLFFRMQPRLEIGDCHFSHKESSVDPHDVAQLWDVSDISMDLMTRANLAFAAVESRWQFVGHYHRWWAATPAGPVDWSGEEPLRFEPSQRYFVIVAAVFSGWCGLLDTELGQLEPLRCNERLKLA